MHRNSPRRCFWHRKKTINSAAAAQQAAELAAKMQQTKPKTKMVRNWNKEEAARQKDAEEDAKQREAKETEAAQKEFAEEETARGKAKFRERMLQAQTRLLEEQARVKVAESVEAAWNKLARWKKAPAERKNAAEAQKLAGGSNSLDKQNGIEAPELSEAELQALMQRSFNGLPQHSSGRRHWIVTGGRNNGGIVVRRGEGLDTKAFQYKLVTGTKIEELEIVGNRLHYKRLVGDGPGWGWVNIMANGKRLVQLLPPRLMA